MAKQKPKLGHALTAIKLVFKDSSKKVMYLTDKIYKIAVPEGFKSKTVNVIHISTKSQKVVIHGKQEGEYIEISFKDLLSLEFFYDGRV